MTYRTVAPPVDALEEDDGRPHEVEVRAEQNDVVVPLRVDAERDHLGMRVWVRVRVRVRVGAWFPF